ncbi:MAG: M23 family metallopeptidase [Endomicrobium sp.]|jgi:murein DD-endopeptidase MepM/ murein hydrolase activator NlpD|nr:M23 family metallopeptidase [Endomicrobium sp.]
MKTLSKIRAEFKKRVTILFIPHGKKSPFKVTISLMAMCVFMLSWTGVTVWSGYIAGRHIDYAATKADNKIMKFRFFFLANRLEKIESMFEQTQRHDEKIRRLLSLNTKKSIIEEGLGQNFGEGGPAPVNTNILMSILSGKSVNLKYSELSRQTDILCEKYKFMERSYDEIITHIDKQKSMFMAMPCGWPCDGRITSVYGFRMHPIYLVRDFHSGLDIANKLHTPVFCTANGRVVYSGWQSGYGNIVVVDHGHNYRTVYGHLSKKFVKTGSYVSRGQIIAEMGNTGSSTGSHLHYEVYFKGRAVNPKQYLTDYFFAKTERNDNA